MYRINCTFTIIVQLDNTTFIKTGLQLLLGDDYATEGLDLEEVGLAHTMENLLYTIPQKCEAALGDHPTDVASFERWSNLDMVDRLWWMLREERTKVRSLVCISVCDILKTSLAWRPW